MAYGSSVLGSAFALVALNETGLVAENWMVGVHLAFVGVPMVSLATFVIWLDAKRRVPWDLDFTVL